MWYRVDQRSSVPIYQQLINGVKEAVAKGVLVEGSKLPSARELATKVMVNPNTIMKAYQELEREGVIENLRGRGTFIASRDPDVYRQEKEQLMNEMIEKILVEAFYLKMEQRDLLRLIERKVETWYAERGKPDEPVGD